MKPRIAVIGLKGLPAFGGAAAVGENLIENLKGEFDFTVLSVNTHTSLKTGYINGVMQIVFKNYGKRGLSLPYYFQCVFHCLTHKYDLIHLHHAASGFITPLLRLRSRVVVTFHGVSKQNDPKFSNWHNAVFRLFERMNFLFANQIVSVSQPDQEFILKKYNKQIKYIPNGITILSSHKEKPTENYILFAAGRIFQVKGLDILLKSAAKINLKMKIYVAGDVDQVEEYKNEILNLGKDLDIEYLGLIKDKNKLESLIANALFFVFPSLNEAMSMMLLEVVALQTPVIASDIPSNKAIFSDDEMLFFRSTDVHDLANKLTYALENKDQLYSRAKKAYEKLISQYTWKNSANSYSQIYKQLIQKK